MKHKQEVAKKQEGGLVNVVKYPPLSVADLSEILGLTIKEDNTNKVITFLGELSAYTKSSQFNISFNAPSSTGKSYIPLEICSLFPKEDVKVIGYCSPTAFFHEVGEYDQETRMIKLDLSRKNIIFLDQPHTLLLQHLRPLLSHDQEEITIKITDKSKNAGLRTKTILIKGYPAVVFCSAGLKLDEQEATRFLLLSPESSQEKIRKAIIEKVFKESDRESYAKFLEDNPKRQALKQRIEAIKSEQISEVNIEANQRKKIEDIFLKGEGLLKPRHTRDVGRVISLVKALALLNLWDRKKEGQNIIANDEDVKQAKLLWSNIAQSQEHNLPPYIYDLYLKIILPMFKEELGDMGITRGEIIKKHYQLYNRSITDWQLRRIILPMLETAGLIFQEPDEKDRRVMMVYPIEDKKEVD